MNFDAKYPMVKFGDTTTNSTQTRWGRRVGKLLIVAYDNNYWRVYRSFDGKFADNDLMFTTIETAIKFSEWMIKIYGEYIDIWRVYSDQEVPSLCRYTVDNGDNLAHLLDSLKNTVVEAWTY